MRRRLQEKEIPTRLVRKILLISEFAGFLILCFPVLRTLRADRWAAKSTIHGLETAVSLDPGNADYHLELGRLLRFDLDNMNPNLALNQISRGVELNPYSPRGWLDLGTALEFQGKIGQAESCFRRVLILAPHLAQFQWVVGNFFLLRGDLDDAFPVFRTVLSGTSEYNAILFDTAWKASGNGSKILEHLIPNHVSTELSYLDYLLTRQRYAEAQKVWERIAASSETFNPTVAARYMDELIQIHQPESAFQVWVDLGKKGLIRPTDEPTIQNLVVNGDFEEDPLNMGFDWRLLPVEGAYIQFDRTTFHSPSHSLEITFTGKQNINFQNVYQYVSVEPEKNYQFRGLIKTEGITTDSGPRLQVSDAYTPTQLTLTSSNFIGSTPGWTPVGFDFKTGPHSDLLLIRVIRPPSDKFDNLIAGKIWLDDVSLSPAPSASAPIN